MFALPANAQDVPDDKRAAMLDLARDFVKKIDKGFKEADEYWFSLKGESADKSSFVNQYQDGEILLLQIKLPGNIKLPGTVMAEKQGNDILISLSDLFTTARFPIAVRPQEGVAEGWFIRENRKFILDYNNGTVRAADKEYAIPADSVKITDDDIWVRGAMLSEWLGFDMDINANAQNLSIEPDTKWPIQEKIEREKRASSRTSDRGSASKPRLEEPYQVAEIPKVDVFLNHRWSRRVQAAKTNRRSGYSIRSSGDVLGHTSESIITGNDTDKLASARFKLLKESENDDLLGPLQARRYEFGDVSATSVPLVGGSKSELGARATNRDPYYTQDTQTTVSGYGIPGWDVELYRDQQFLAIATVGDNGLYEFEDVSLFAGENRFRVVQYGLQGEIEEQEFVQFVDASLRGAKSGVYDVSLTMNDTQTYFSGENKDVDKNSPHLSATYEAQATNNLALRAGLKLREEDGEQKAYVQTGAVTNFNGVIVNADAAVDDEGAYATALSARKTFKDLNVSGNIGYTGEDYSVDSSQSRDAELVVRGGVNGRLSPITALNLSTPRYNFDTEYRRRGDDYTSYRTAAGVSARYDRLNFNTGLNYRVEDDSGTVDRNLSGRIGVRGNYLKTGLRATASADIYPNYEPTKYELSAQRNLTKAIQGRAKIEYDPRVAITETELGLSWTGEHVVLSPNLTYDSEKNITAFINARFGLVYNPLNKDVEMYGQQLSGRGGVSALIYLDRNGDNIFNDGDEVIKDARIEAMQTSRFALSDEDGVVFIQDLPTNRITDIALNESSLPDPFWVAGFEGVSVRPRAGHTSVLEFPVHIAGEIDGVVYAASPIGAKAPIKNMRVELYNEKGELANTAYSAFDGFYLFSRVPPGEYVLMVNADDARNRKVDAPAPQKITIGYEGTIVAGKELIVTRQGLGVEFDMVEAKDFGYDLAKIDPAMLTGKKVLLNLGDYHSQLLMALTWYNMRNRYGAILGDAKLIVPPSESLPSLASNMHTMRVTTDILNFEDARLICRSLIARGFQCGVELLPDAFFTELSAGALSSSGKS